MAGMYCVFYGYEQCDECPEAHQLVIRSSVAEEDHGCAAPRRVCCLFRIGGKEGGGGGVWLMHDVGRWNSRSSVPLVLLFPCYTKMPIKAWPSHRVRCTDRLFPMSSHLHLLVVRLRCVGVERRGKTLIRAPCIRFWWLARVYLTTLLSTTVVGVLFPSTR